MSNAREDLKTREENAYKLLHVGQDLQDHVTMCIAYADLADVHREKRNYATALELIKAALMCQPTSEHAKFLFEQIKGEIRTNPSSHFGGTRIRTRMVEDAEKKPAAARKLF